jgi:glyoxylase-like metal-dependent hydrolase (beta-lactamase superfamily II)
LKLRLNPTQQSVIFKPASIFSQEFFMIRTTVIAASLAVAFTAQAAQPLTVKIYNAGGSSFNVNSTLVYGEKEAMVIDAGFTRADALRIAANVLDSGKQLTTIYVSQADPDYYFGVETLKEIFPQADVVTTPAVLEKLVAKMSGKLAFWGPKMGANAPRKPVAPRALEGNTLKLEGQTIEIRGTQGLLAHRPYAWIPSIKAIVGNIGVFGGMHVWTADTQSVAERAAWVAQLNEMSALNPELVVPGHMTSGAKVDASAIIFTKDYLQTFEKNLVSSKDGAGLINAMKLSYPQVTEGALSLDIGSKVNKGEMKW